MEDWQLRLLESGNYVYRVFATNDKKRPHVVIEDYKVFQKAKREHLVLGKAEELSPRFG